MVISRGRSSSGSGQGIALDLPLMLKGEPDQGYKKHQVGAGYLAIRGNASDCSNR